MNEDIEKRILENTEAQKQAHVNASKQHARSEALRYVPTRRANTPLQPDGYLTAKEITNEAEIIYQWLIKDL